MTVNELQKDLVAQAPYKTTGVPFITQENTVDKIIIGDGNTVIKKGLVTWMCMTHTIEHALANGYNLIVTHEPTFWSHADELESIPHLHQVQQISAAKKRKLIEDSGLVILRVHDFWDAYPGQGIPYALARALELGTHPSKQCNYGYQLRYDIEAISISELLTRAKKMAAPFGENHVIYSGNPQTKISKIGVGTGCMCDIQNFIELGCDFSVICDDGSSYWHQLSHAIEFGHAFLRLNHCTSEEPGMPPLADYLRQHYALTMDYFPFRSGIKAAY